MGRDSILLLSTFFTLAAVASSLDSSSSLSSQQLGSDRPGYKFGDSIPITCLSRSTETGEHKTDTAGNLIYEPFFTCNETGRPLELRFGVEQELNCTIDFVSDDLFHVLEYYVHSDAPLSCRIPSRPLPAASAALLDQHPIEGQGTLNTAGDYIPLVLALAGTLQLSHLHVASQLNMLLHAAPASPASSAPAAAAAANGGMIAAGTAYSISSPADATRIVIGDALPLRFDVRWYPDTRLPREWSAVGGHILPSTLVYCALCAGAATAICIVYFRSVELPRRLRSHAKDRTSGMEGGGAGRLGGYGYGFGAGGGVGKRD